MNVGILLGLVVATLFLESLSEATASSCSRINQFQQSCLSPVLGGNSGQTSFDMEFACEALFWHQPESQAFVMKGFLKARNCSEITLSVLGTDSAVVDGCGLAANAWADVRNFMTACAYHVGTDPPLEIYDGFSHLPPRALWAKARELRNQGALGPTQSMTTAPKRRTALRTAAVSEVRIYRMLRSLVLVVFKAQTHEFTSCTAYTTE
jgi:hypothetical protein